MENSQNSDKKLIKLGWYGKKYFSLINKENVDSFSENPIPWIGVFCFPTSIVLLIIYASIFIAFKSIDVILLFAFIFLGIGLIITFYYLYERFFKIESFNITDGDVKEESKPKLTNKKVETNHINSPTFKNIKGKVNNKSAGDNSSIS